MKKLLLIAVVAAVTLVAGCSNSKKADVDDENVAVKTTGDSISMYLGTLYGAQMVQMADSSLNKTEFIDGMKTALNTASMDSLQKMGMALSQQAQAATGAEKDKLQSRLGGMGMAAQYMLPAIEGMKAQFKIELNKAVLLKYFKEAMTADKPVDTKAAEEALDKIMNRFSPMPGNNAVDTKAAEENAKAGAAYIEKEMKADKSLKKTASGLVYKVIKKGVGAKPTKDQTAMSLRVLSLMSCPIIFPLSVMPKSNVPPLPFKKAHKVSIPRSSCPVVSLNSMDFPSPSEASRWMSVYVSIIVKTALFYAYKLHVEDEGLVGADRAAGSCAALSIAEIAGDIEAVFGSGAHKHQSFAEAWHNARYGKFLHLMTRFVSHDLIITHK